MGITQVGPHLAELDDISGLCKRQLYRSQALRPGLALWNSPLLSLLSPHSESVSYHVDTPERRKIVEEMV